MNDCLFLPADVPAELSECQSLYWQPAQGPGLSLSWAQCINELSGREVALVLPMEVVSAAQVQLPTDKPRWLRQTLPYAVEECFADEVEQLHLALGECLADGRYRVLATRRESLAGWLAQLREQAIQVKAIYVDADLLPRSGVQVLLAGERGLLGGEGPERLAFAAEMWPTLAERFPDASVQRESKPWPSLKLGQSRAVDLAQAELAVKPARASGFYWRAGLGLAACAFLLQIAFSLASGVFFNRQGDAYAAHSRVLYQQLFPQDSRIVNVRAQLDEHLRKRNHTDASGLFLLLDQASLALQHLPNVTVQKLDYRLAANEMVLQLLGQDFATLEQLRLALVQAGLSVQLGSATRAANGVSARLVIGGGA